jgi:hypothetical protein
MSAPPNLPIGLAIRRTPSKIHPGPEGSKPFSYPLLVQPVLDKHCVKCHGGERKPITKPDFFGSRTSPLITMLREGHEGVELNDEEFERLITWADNNVLFYGTFDPEGQARQLRGERIKGPLVD